MRTSVFLAVAMMGCGAVTEPPNDAVGDTTAPQLVSSVPADGASEVAPTTPISVEFDEAIAGSTLTAASFTVKDDRGTPVAGTITPTANGGTFMPASPLLIDRTYTAQITTAVTDAAGNPLAAEVAWSFAPHRRAWGTASLVETDNRGPAGGHRIVVDPSGNAVAVWSQSDGTRGSVWASRFVATSGWQLPVLLEHDDTGEAQTPDVAIDADGNAIVTWDQFDGTRSIIWFARLQAGFGWSAANQIPSSNIGNAYSAKVAMTANGAAVAVWEQLDLTSRTSIYSSRYSPSSGWSLAQLVETNDTADAGGADVEVDAAGNAIAIWQQFDGAGRSLWSSRLVGNAWSAASRIDTDQLGDPESPQFAIDAAGNAIAVWTQSDGTHVNAWTKQFVVGSGWGSARLLETAVGDANGPRIAIDGAGNALAVWAQQEGTRYDVWSSRFVPSTGWAAPILVETSPAGDAVLPAIALDADGNAVAVWMQLTNALYNITASRWSSATGWSPAVPVETDDSGHGIAPEVVVDPAGNAITLWQQSDGTRTNIAANTLR